MGANPPLVPAGRRAVFIASPQFRRPSYGKNHPLAIPRVALTLDLVRAFGAIGPGELLTARKAADFELEWFHAREYVAAIRMAETLGRVKTAWRERFRLGTLENPFFAHLFTTPATATGASVQAAEEVLAGRVAFNPAGGMHHARPGHAQGFCYFNDPALAVIRLRRAGVRVLYVDLDAHHADAVEDAFARDPEVLTLSLHMDSRYAYPNAGGRFEDCGTAEGRHATINSALPKGVNDSEYRLVFDAAWGRAVERFRPDAVVLQAGTDALAVDPLGKLALSTQGFLAIARTIVDSSPRHPDGTPRLVATGGGGYHPIAVARAWTGLWAVLSGRELDAAVPPAGAELLRSVLWEGGEDDEPGRLFESLADEPADGPVREEIRALARRIPTHPFLSQ
ncbi:MAG TPA: acetoin utilization protein AcuC [Burkholderiales bacterium]|nr:acetoin utilization protein AcuC [Burkholderiales bacterium]